MGSIDRNEFNKRLNENKFHEDMDKHIEYRLPVVQYYFDYLIDGHINSFYGAIPLRGINLNYKKDNFKDINLAFNWLVENRNRF